MSAEMDACPSSPAKAEMDACPSSPAKRPAEETIQPDAKRAKGSSPEMVKDICNAISSVSISLPWSASLRELLLSLAPGALQGQRNGSEEIMVRMFDEIFCGEEKRMQDCIEESKKHEESIAEKKGKAVTAEEEATKNLQEMVEELKQKMDGLPKEIQLVVEAETKLRQTTQELLTKQKEALSSSMVECFEVLKTGSYADEAAALKLLAAFMPVLRQNITDATLLSSSEGALAKKPEDRGSFDGAVVKQLGDDLDKRLVKLTERCELAAAPVEAQAAATTVESVTFEEAEIMLKQGNQLELARQRTMVTEARQKSYELLKAGIDAPRLQKKHIIVLKKACKKVPDSKALVANFPAVLQKKPSARGEYDLKILEQLESGLDKAIASFGDQIEEATQKMVDEQKQVEADFNAVKQAVEMEGEEADSKQQMVTKERDTLMEMKLLTFQPLKAGTWVTPADLKPLLPRMKKLLKQLEIDDATTKTIIDIFKKQPEARQGFDGVMVGQIEDTIDKRLATFDQQLGNFATMGKYSNLKEVVADVDAAQEALEDARETQQVRLQEAIYADKERLRLEGVLEQKQTAMSLKIEEEKQAAASHVEQQSSLEQFRQARDNLAFLREQQGDREAPSPGAASAENA